MSPTYPHIDIPDTDTFMTPGAPHPLSADERRELHARVVLFQSDPQVRFTRLASQALEEISQLEARFESQRQQLSEARGTIKQLGEDIRELSHGLRSVNAVLRRTLEREWPRETMPADAEALESVVRSVLVELPSARYEIAKVLEKHGTGVEPWR